MLVLHATTQCMKGRTGRCTSDLAGAYFCLLSKLISACLPPTPCWLAVATVVHLSPLEVVRLPAYRQWLQSFAPGAQHILVAESVSSGVPVMRKSALVQASRGCMKCLFRSIGSSSCCQSSPLTTATAAPPAAAGQAQPDRRRPLPTARRPRQRGA